MLSGLVRHGAVSLVLSVSMASAGQAPKILIDQPPRAVEYQLGRLTNDELALVERKEGDVRYRPVYYAILTRRGMAAQYRDEAVAALVALDKTSRSRVLMEALGKVPNDDQLTTDKLASMLLSQPAETLRGERAQFEQAIESGTAGSPALRVAFAALLVVDGKPEPTWSAAQKKGQVADLLQGTGLLTGAVTTDAVRAALTPPITRMLAPEQEPTIRAAAIEALAATSPTRATFELLAREVSPSAPDAVRTAAVAALQRIPETEWPAASIEPLTRALVASVAALPTEGRTEPAALDALQFGERLAAKLPDDPRKTIRRELRAIGVQVVRITTLPEKLAFDVKWFAVEAGKPVQIVLFNPDAMPHNLLISQPGSLEAVGTAGAAMPMPTDPAAKAFVPDLPAVLFSTKLLKEGETERLGFTAPKEPGEYVFVCTFPGHWVRMYGVMLVVANLEAWEAKPTVPIDPMTKQPFSTKQ
jgi:hypothetical protein